MDDGRHARPSGGVEVTDELIQRLVARAERAEASDHAPTIRRFASRGGAPVVYRVYCSCGQYKTAVRTNDLAAWSNWLDHARAFKAPNAAR